MDNIGTSKSRTDRFSIKDVEARVNNGGAALSPEEVLDEWRAINPEIGAERDIEAIQEALDDMEHGDRGMPFDQWDREFRRRHNLDETT